LLKHLKVTKSITNLHKKFCEFPPWSFWFLSKLLGQYRPLRCLVIQKKWEKSIKFQSLKILLFKWSQKSCKLKLTIFSQFENANLGAIQIIHDTQSEVWQCHKSFFYFLKRCFNTIWSKMSYLTARLGFERYFPQLFL